MSSVAVQLNQDTEPIIVALADSEGNEIESCSVSRVLELLETQLGGTMNEETGSLENQSNHYPTLQQIRTDLGAGSRKPHVDGYQIALGSPDGVKAGSLLFFQGKSVQG